jgi:pimeloyl-ACP methyl ester carboxylesterase
VPVPVEGGTPQPPSGRRSRARPDGLARRGCAGETSGIAFPRLVSVLVGLLLVGCGGHERNDASERRHAVEVPGVGSGGRFDVGGRQLYVECMGSGAPTVVLEAGWGGTSANWTSVLPKLARNTRACAYDRAGLGASDAIPGVHDAGDETKDLERLLDRAGIHPPYVLVGHSYGGLLARLFAAAQPERTGGLVLLDALGRDAWRRELAAWPKWFAREQRRAMAKPVDAGIDLRATAALDNRIRSLGDIPLIVITAAQERAQYAAIGADPPAGLYRRGLRLWRTMQTELARLSRDRVHVIALESDHFVQDDQPLVVIAAVRAVVRAVRDRAPLPPCERVFNSADVRCLS